MIEKQINGDPALNYVPGKGVVKAPYLSWGLYLWINGLDPRSNGLVWTPEDLAKDCIHPSTPGRTKVANMLLEFLKTDTTAASWFISETTPLPTPTPSPSHRKLYIPVISSRIQHGIFSTFVYADRFANLPSYFAT